MFPFGDILKDMQAGGQATETVEEKTEEAVAETAVEEAPAAEAVTDNGDEKVKKERKKPNRQIVDADVKFVLQNFKSMSYQQLADAQGLTKHQVGRIASSIKKSLRDSAAGNAAKEAAVEKFIADNLTRPEESRVGGGGDVKAAIDAVVDNIIATLK